MLKVSKCISQVIYMRRISVCRILHNEDSDSNNTAENQLKRKVKETVELVTLVDQNDKILGLKPKKESELLAKKLKLSLERVTDPKYGKIYPAYKMFVPADLLKQEKKASTAKVLKKLPINSRISDNDLTFKLKTIRKWLEKNCEVHIAILKSSQADSAMKNVFTQMKEDLMHDGRIIDIRHKEDAIKFIILPPKQNSNKNTAGRTNDKKENSDVNS